MGKVIKDTYVYSYTHNLYKRDIVRLAVTTKYIYHCIDWRILYKQIVVIYKTLFTFIDCYATDYLWYYGPRKKTICFHKGKRSFYIFLLTNCVFPPTYWKYEGGICRRFTEACVGFSRIYSQSCHEHYWCRSFDRR